MKLLRLLPTLALALLAASPAFGDVLFRGLSYAPHGACVADVGADGRLVLSNIGSSGQDGVSIWSPRSNGARVVLDGTCSPLDVGSSVSLVHRVSLNGLPPGQPVLRVASVSFSVVGADASGPSRCVCAPDFSSVSSSSSMTVQLMRGGVVVRSSSLSLSSSVSVSFDASSSCPMPALSFSSRGTVTPRVLQARCTFPSSVHVSLDGEDEDCDGIVFLCPSEDCDDTDDALRVTAPQGSSLSTVRCSDGSCRVFDHWVSGTGASSLDFSTFSSGSSSARRLPVHNLGSSGQDGVEIQLDRRAPDSPLLLDAASSVDPDNAASSLVFSPPSLTFDPATDNGASAHLTIVGRAFSSGASSVAHASISLTLQGSNFGVAFDHSSLGASAESVLVLNQGAVVGRFAVPPDDRITVTAPPGEPAAFVVTSAGKHTKSGHVTLLKHRLPAGGFAAGGADAIERTFVAPHVFESTRFASSRIFLFGGQSVVGDELVAWGEPDCSSGTCPDGFVASSTSLRVACPNPASSLSSLDLASVADDQADAIFADVPASGAISSAHTCVSVPFVFTRSDATPARAYSVTFHVSPELQRCSPQVVEGSYLSRVADTQMFVLDNGGGSYTVDCGILGTVCGATGSGTLFSVDFSAMQPVSSSFGTITVDAVQVRDCSNADVPASAGAVSVLPIVVAAPPALSGLSATQVKSGNTGSTTAVSLSWPSSSSSSSVSLYRKGFGNYPLYDNGTSPGAVPSPPASSSAALALGWSPVSCSSGACTATCSSGSCSLVDSPPDRDVLYYVAFVRDAYGNESPCSNMTPGTLDYHLGDVSDGSSVCVGDDHVDILDISALGSHYGAQVSSGTAFSCLDVGPTLDRSPATRPSTDGFVNFEDFMMFAMNFGAVSAPEAARRPAPAVANATRLDVPALPGVGETFDVGVMVDGAGDVQGLSARLAFDPAIVEQVGVAPGVLLDQQGRGAMVLSSGPGNVDAALLGAGAGIAGSGEVARVTFRVKAQGDPALALASLTARDANNEPVAVAGANDGIVRVSRTALGFAFPNPFAEAVGLQLSLRAAGPATVAVFDVAGRRVRTLVQGVQPAGTRVVTWDGRDDSGIRMAPGAYLVRLEAGTLRETRPVRLVR